MINIEVIRPQGKIFDGAKAVAAMHSVMRDTVSEGQRYMAEYPPQPAASGYRRTGTLKRSWNGEVHSGGGIMEGIVGSSGNIAPYNSEVQGINQKPLFDDIGWHDVADLAAKINNELPLRLQDSLKGI